MNTEWFAPHWLEATSGENVDWLNDELRVKLLANILLHQRRSCPRYSPGTDVTSVEVISDGINRAEPRWHGLNTRCEIFHGAEYDSLKTRVREYRERIGTHYATHYRIAELFYRPV